MFSFPASKDHSLAFPLFTQLLALPAMPSVLCRGRGSVGRLKGDQYEDNVLSLEIQGANLFGTTIT